MRNRVAVVLAAGAVALGTFVIVGSATAAPVGVQCTSDGTTLTCPLPAPSTVTVTQTATVTATVTATPASTSVAPTTTVASTTVSQPPVTSSATSSTVPTTTTAATTTTAPAGTWPGASNTGVPAGTALSTYTGSCTISTANTVIDSKTVNCGLTIRAAGVIIRKSKINGNVWMDQDYTPNASFTLTDSEVDAGKVQVPAICCGNYTVLRVNSHGGQNGGQCENGASYCKITDSWLHGQYVPPGGNWHLGGFLSDGGTPGQLVHNTIVCDRAAENDEGSCTGDINLIPNFGPMSNWLIQGNYLGANRDASFCTYGGEKSTSPYPHGDHIVYKDNVFQKSNTKAEGTTNTCAYYGPVTSFNVNGVGNVWTNNKYDDGTTVQPAN